MIYPRGRSTFTAGSFSCTRRRAIVECVLGTHHWAPKAAALACCHPPTPAWCAGCSWTCCAGGVVVLLVMVMMVLLKMVVAVVAMVLL